MKLGRKNDGFVLTGVLMLLLIATLVGGAFLFSARNSFASVDKWRERDDCLTAIQSGLEQREYELMPQSSTGGLSYAVLNGVANKVNESWTKTHVNNWSTDPSTVVVTGITDSCSVSSDLLTGTIQLTITNTAWTRLGKTTRKVREVITIISTSALGGGGAGNVFDNTFFIDNIGVFSGVNCDFNGDVYANKDMDLKFSSMKVNGDSRAGGVNVSGSKIYKSDAWGTPSSAGAYGSQSYSGVNFANRVRPAEYTQYDKTKPQDYWPQGYKGSCVFYDNQPVLDMPFIGPLSDYETMAVANTGTVSGIYRVSATGVLTNRNLGTVSAVWGDGAGENAGVGTNDTGALILIGTAANPIQLNRIFVARGDIYIRGYYTGRGTLYAGRNIYVIGDLRAVNPPTWNHPDSNPSNTAAINRNKDFLGLCAKGSVSLGDQSEMNVSFLTTPVTGSHATDISDIELGYVSYTANGVPYFNGNYTARDGNGSQLRSDGTPRYFYTPMIGSTAFTGLGGVGQIGWLDVVLYANHLIAGDYASNAVLNGAMICRDESIVRHGNLSYNWDIRVGSKSKDGQNFNGDFQGPQTTPHTTMIVKWTELVP
ncbi:MAG: hypothetical protein WCH86_03470 [Kiritimatiellales bacterium]